MGKFIVAPPASVKTFVTCNVPGPDGYEEHRLTARIKKLYGEAKSELMDNVGDKKDIEIIKELVIELPDLEFYPDPEDDSDCGPGVEVEVTPLPFGDGLFDKLADIDYILRPLARECLAVQDEGLRRGLQEKN